MKRNTKLIGGGLGILGALVAIVLGVTTIRSGLAQALYNARTNVENAITLDSSNKVTSSGDINQRTAKGNNVTFTYNNVQTGTSGHATLNDGGYIVNKDQITSLSAITATYSGAGTLKARIAYVNETDKWNDYFTLVSGSRVELGSNPYYL